MAFTIPEVTEAVFIAEARDLGGLPADAAPEIAIAGRSNVGKSTLLNRLAGYESAIVTPIPGTTRDVLRERVLLDGVPLEILDTAGLRETLDLIEAEGVRRAHDAITRADRLLFVIDAATDPSAEAWAQVRATLPAGLPVTLVFNKSDLCATAPLAPAAPATPLGASRADPGAGPGARAEPVVVRISALSGEGLDALREHLKACFGLAQPEHGTIAARARHVEALARVEAHLEAAGDALRGRRTSELIAEELRLAERALGEIVGPQQNEELLGRIFSSFCIGK